MTMRHADSAGQAPIRVWGLSDFHLHFATMPAELAFITPAHQPPWLTNAKKIARNWAEKVGPRDIVLVPGDASSARNHAEVQRDLAWLAKRRCAAMVMSPGNHDLWFGRIAGVQRILRPGQYAVDGTAADLGPAIVCGARSVPTPDDPMPVDSKAEQVADTAYAKLKLALADAVALRDAAGNDKPIIVLWHHPPFDRWGRPDPVVALMSEAGVKACVYGHVHTKSQWQTVPQGEISGISFACVAADSLGFRPRKIMELTESSDPAPETDAD
jgi:predicted phosphohydrolase